MEDAARPGGAMADAILKLEIIQKSSTRTSALRKIGGGSTLDPKHTNTNTYTRRRLLFLVGSRSVDAIFS